MELNSGLDVSTRKQREMENVVKDLNQVVKEQREKIEHLCQFHNDAAATFEARLSVAREQSERLEKAESDLERLCLEKSDQENFLEKTRREYEGIISDSSDGYKRSLEALKVDHDTLSGKLQSELLSHADV